MIFIAKRINPFLSARLFFVTPSAAERRVKLVFIQRLFKPVGFHHIGVLFAAVRKRPDALIYAILIDMNK